MKKLLKIKHYLHCNPEVAKQYQEALKAVSESGGLSEVEAISQAAGKMGYAISPEEVERAIAEVQELSEEELALVSAGTAFTSGTAEFNERDVHWCLANHSCWTVYSHDREGEDQACFADYVCLMAFK